MWGATASAIALSKWALVGSGLLSCPSNPEIGIVPSFSRIETHDPVSDSEEYFKTNAHDWIGVAVIASKLEQEIRRRKNRLHVLRLKKLSYIYTGKQWGLVRLAQTPPIPNKIARSLLVPGCPRQSRIAKALKFN